MRTYDKSNAVWLKVQEPPAALLAFPDAIWKDDRTLIVPACVKCCTPKSNCRCGQQKIQDATVFETSRGLNQTLLDDFLANAAESVAAESSPVTPVSQTQPTVEPNAAPCVTEPDNDADLSDEDIVQMAVDYLEQNPLAGKKDIQDYLTSKIELTDEDASGLVYRAFQIAIWTPKQVVQPDQQGEFPRPVDGALWMASRGIPQTPLRPNTKDAFLPDWPSKATCDPKQIMQWWNEYPGCNFGSVALQGGPFVFEADKPEQTDVPPIRDRFESTGQYFTSRFVIQSSPGKGHRWYSSCPGIENIGQEAAQHHDFSVRVNNQYCCSPGSIHPRTLQQYRVIESGPLAVPSPEEIAFWKSECKAVKQPPTVIGDKIPKGSHDIELHRIAGRLRWDGLEEEAIYSALVEVCEKRCENLGEDYLKMCRKHAHEICKKPAGPPVVLVRQADGTMQPAGTAQPTPVTAAVSTLITKEQLLERIASEEAIKADQLTAELNKPWPDVIPLKPELLPVLPFQSDFLPAAIRPWVVDVAQRLSVPLDFTGVCSICTLSGVIGRRAFVYPKARDKDWKESIAISGAVVASSAKKKTPVWAFFTKILQKIDMHRREEYTKVKALYDSSVKNWEDEEAKRQKKPGAKCDLAMLGFPKPQEPEKARRCIVNDCTPEALHDILSLNPEGVLFFRDELSSWIEESAKAGREAQLKFFMSCMNGDDIYVMDRITRGLIAAIVCTAVFGGFQPKLLVDFLQGDGGRHIASGLVPRFFALVWPDEIPAVWTDSEPNEQARQTFEDICKKLAGMTEQSVTLHFSPEAQQRFKQWDAENTAKIDLEENEGLRSHLGKYPGQLARLAGLFQLVDLCCLSGPIQGSHQIDLQHLEQAIRMTVYLESHARRVYGCIQTAVQIAERSLAGHILAGDLPETFKLRDVAQKDWAGLTDRDYCEYACDLLEDKGWIRKIEPAQGSKGGRPTVKYQINPAIRAGSVRSVSRGREAA